MPHVITGRPSAGNLPAELTTFVGRHRALAELMDLANNVRLLTLIGPPGAGKSRLARRLAAEIAGRFRDGAWWVELAPLTQGGLVAPAVMRALGLGARHGRESQEVVGAWLEGRQALLILDNCEHLLQPTAELAEHLLGRCRDVMLIATSRERLRIGAETTWLVDPLSEADAVELFIQRAPTNAVQPATAGLAIAHVCRRLDGLPLAIELAAARTGSLTVEAIEARIADRFRLLTGGSRTAPARQQTLKAALQWSHDLLTPDERLVMRRLAVFVGGFDLAAAEAICSDGQLEVAAVTGTVVGLVEKSLVEAGGNRYRMLETVRQFGHDQLLESDEIEAVRRRHAGYFVGLVGGIEADRATQKEPEWLDRFATDHDNFLAALEWAVENEPESAARLLVALSLGWYVNGEIREALDWLARGMELPIADASLRTRVLLEAGQFAHLAGDLATARDRYERGLAAARRIGEGDVLARCLELSGALHSRTGKLALARSQLRESLRLYEALDWPASAGALNLRLGAVDAAEGHLPEARQHYERGVELSRGKSDRVLGAAVALLGVVALAQQDLGVARSAARESAQLALRCGDRRDACYALGLSAAVAASGSSFVRAMTLQAAADTLVSKIGIELEPEWETFIAGVVSAARGVLAPPTVEAALARGRLMGFEEALLYASSVRDSDVAASLTRRELEVAALVADGLTARQIATRLFIAERTAESHIERIRGKLGVRSRGQIATWFVEQRWLQI